MAFGTGGVKPCVSTNVGDQFTSSNKHLIERAFSYFYLSINLGSSFSIYKCPEWLETYGPKVAFGVPAAMMALATLVFYLGRKRFAVVPPAGKQWLKDILSPAGLKLIGNLLIVYLFVAMFWALWDQSNGQTWTLQATSDLMDKHMGFGLVLLPAQIQVVNGLLILIMVPIFTFGIYPLCSRFVKVTPLRKISVGLFLVAASFLVVGWIERRIQSGHSVSRLVADPRLRGADGFRGAGVDHRAGVFLQAGTAAHEELHHGVVSAVHQRRQPDDRRGQ